MSRKDVGGRRLNLQAALGATLQGLPRLWSGSAGALVLCALLWLIPVLWFPSGWAGVAWGTAATVASVVAVGGLARLSISADVHEARALGLGSLGLQAKRPEARLVGAFLLCLLFLTMILSILALVVLAIFGMAELDVQAIQAQDWADVGEPWKLGVLAVLGFGAIAIPLSLVVHLSLFAPATLGRRQMVSLNGMGIVGGSFWPLLAAYLVTSVPLMLLLALSGTGVLNGEVGHLVQVVGIVGLQLPLTLGLMGVAYRQLEDWSAKEPKR